MMHVIRESSEFVGTRETSALFPTLAVMDDREIEDYMRRLHPNTLHEDERQKLFDQISQMGEQVTNMIADSVRALVERDNELAHRTIELDHQIDRFEVETYDFSLGILGRGQMVASDLRFLMTGLKLATDLERIGDLCVNICERAIELNGEKPLMAYEDLPRMGAVAQEMLCGALMAFIDGDPAHVRRVIERDRAIDAHYAQLSSQIRTFMGQDSEDKYRATRVHDVAKYLERIGDDATHVAEMVVFMAKGKHFEYLDQLERAV